jgi:hypothetical protein
LHLQIGACTYNLPPHLSESQVDRLGLGVHGIIFKPRWLDLELVG